MNIMIDVKMFDKNVFDLYTQNDNGFARKIGSFELDNLPDVALSFAKKYNSDVVTLVGLLLVMILFYLLPLDLFF